MVNSRISESRLLRDNLSSRTPMRCPVCGGDLTDVHIRDLGGVTATIIWQIHAGECPEHGWFQAEFTAKPPREIFPVTRPYGTVRRVVLNGEEYFGFTTVWGSADREKKLEKIDPLDRSRGERVDPLDPAQWATEPILP